ncbi:MAG: hypothetical protein ACTHQQ_06155 [Solirubrobacteraceae bacterium]
MSDATRRCMSPGGRRWLYVIDSARDYPSLERPTAFLNVLEGALR